MYSEICLDESSSISYDIQDNTNLKKINFRANIDTNTTFVKTFHIAVKINDKYELLIINVKRIDNCIYVYKIFNNVTKLLKTIDLTEEYNTGNNDIDTRNNILLYKLIKVSHDWKTLTIPTGTHIMLCSTQSIFNNDINYEKIQFNKQIIENISKYKFFAYADRIMILYEKHNSVFLYTSNYASSVDLYEIFNLDHLDHLVIDMFYFSENGKFISYYSDIKQKMFIYSVLCLNNKIQTSINLDGKFSNKWLISDDGKLLLNRNNDCIFIVSKYGKLSITNNIDDLKSKSCVVMLKSVALYPNIETYTLVLWNRVLQRYTLIGIVVNPVEHKQITTNMYRINYNVKNNKTSIHTNGNIYVYKDDKTTTINDIKIFFHIPLIRYICSNILERYEFNENTEILGSVLTIGNMTSTANCAVTNNLCKLFTPLQDQGRFIIDTFNNINIEILDNGKKKLDVVNVVLYIFEDLQNIDILFEKLKKDKHYLSKVYLIFEYMKDIYNYISDYNIPDKNLHLSKMYIEMAILYAITIYKSIKISDERSENIVSSIYKLTNLFKFSVF